MRFISDEVVDLRIINHYTGLEIEGFFFVLDTVFEVITRAEGAES